jgi:hypothetical protein
MASVAGSAMASSIGMGKIRRKWWEGSWHHCQESAAIGYDSRRHHMLSRLTRPEPKIGPRLRHRGHPGHFELGRRTGFFLAPVRTGPIRTATVHLRWVPGDAFKLTKDRVDRAKRDDSNFLWESAQQPPKPAYAWLEG